MADWRGKNAGQVHKADATIELRSKRKRQRNSATTKSKCDADVNGNDSGQSDGDDNDNAREESQKPTQSQSALASGVARPALSVQPPNRIQETKAPQPKTTSATTKHNTTQ